MVEANVSRLGPSFDLRAVLTFSLINRKNKAFDTLLLLLSDIMILRNVFSGAVYNQNPGERRTRMNMRTENDDCENKLEQQKLKQILLSKLAKYKV